MRAEKIYGNFRLHDGQVYVLGGTGSRQRGFLLWTVCKILCAITMNRLILCPRKGAGDVFIPEFPKRMNKFVKRFYPALLIGFFLVIPAILWYISTEYIQECRSVLIGKSWLAGAGLILLKEGLGRRMWNESRSESPRRLKRIRNRSDQIARILFILTGGGIFLVSVVDMLIILFN